MADLDARMEAILTLRTRTMAYEQEELSKQEAQAILDIAKETGEEVKVAATSDSEEGFTSDSYVETGDDAEFKTLYETDGETVSGF